MNESAMPSVLVVASAIALVSLLAAACAVKSGVRLAGWLALSGAPAVAALIVTRPLLRLGLLELASLLAALMIWRGAKTKSAAWTFIAMVAISAATLVPGTVLLERGNVSYACILLTAGFFLKLGLAPFSLWLPRVAGQVSSLAMAVVIAVIDIAAFAELCVVSQAAPAIFAWKGLWLAAAAVSALGASLLMLSERDLRRLLALSTVEDIGFLTFGLASATSLGREGAILGAAVHAVGKALLFISLAAPESNGELRAESRGLAGRYPASAAGFLFGMLAVLGIPPTVGFAGRWRLYETAAGMGAGWLMLFVAASMLSLIAYVRALTTTWWGASDGPSPNHGERLEPAIAKWTMLLLAALVIVAGLWPHGVEALLRGVR